MAARIATRPSTHDCCCAVRLDVELANGCSLEHMPLATYKMVRLAFHRLEQRLSYPTKAVSSRRDP